MSSTRQLKIKRALISVSDKANLETLAPVLIEHGVEIISSGGTAKHLEGMGIPTTKVTEITKNPEAFGGRMKTISFQIGSSLLFRRDNPKDLEDAKNLGIQAIDLVVCNLYPFEKAVRDKVSEDELIEQIDIGGPTMVRAAAKNFKGVAIVTNPDMYDCLIEQLKENQGNISFDLRKVLALKAFQYTAKYELMIANELERRFCDNQQNTRFFVFEEGRTLRYGENSHQSAQYFNRTDPYSNLKGIGSAQIIQGKKLSYNNLLDADSSWKCASEILEVAKQDEKYKDYTAVTVVKHLNPCGVALCENPLKALKMAWDCDPISAFGSIITFTKEVTKECVEWLLEGKFIELLIAPAFEQKALDLIAKKKNVRVLINPLKALNNNEETIKSVAGGILIQNEDEGLDSEFKQVTKKDFPKELETLAHFGVICNKFLKSNSVCIVGRQDQGLVLVGAGMGQPNRVESLRKLAIPQAQTKDVLIGDCILISDAFFPFSDSIEIAHQAGLKYIVQPGGSIKDKDVIKACDESNIAMAFTGRRHFRH